MPEAVRSIRRPPQQAASPAKKPFPDSRQFRELRELLGNGVKQIILNGAPGTGKTYTAALLAKYLGTPLPGENDSDTLVQFHPSYDYTDFVEGLRPVEGENGRMIYKS